MIWRCLLVCSDSTITDFYYIIQIAMGWSDGGDTVRDLQLYMNPNAEHILDWFHIAMRLTVMHQMAKALGAKGSKLRERAMKELKRYGMGIPFVPCKP